MRPGCWIHRAAAEANPFPDAMQAAQAKVFASEMAVKVTNDALQLFGARGYSRNEKIERYVRDARMFTIGRRHGPDSPDGDRKPFAGPETAADP